MIRILDENDKQELDQQIGELSNEIDGFTKGVGSQNINGGNYVIGGLENGVLKSGWADCLTSQYIEVKPKKTLVYAYGTDGKNFVFFAEYDQDKVFIKQTQIFGYLHTGTVNRLTLSNTTKYIRFYTSYGAGNTPPISTAQFALYYLDDIPEPFIYKEYAPQKAIDLEKVYYGDELVCDQLVFKEKEKAIVLFNFDAGNIYDVRATKLEEYGWKGTFCSNEHNQTNVKLFVQHGHDIAFYKGKYSESAPSIYTSEDSYEAWYNYIKGGVDELNALGVYFPTLYGAATHKGGIQMFNACKALGFKYVSCSYELVSGESWDTDNDCRWFSNETNSPNEVGLKPTGMDKTVDELRTILSTAVANKQVVSLFTHGVEVTPTSDINISTEHYVDILDLVKEFVDNGTIEVMTMREFYNKFHQEEGHDLDFKRTMSAIMDLKKSEQ